MKGKVRYAEDIRRLETFTLESDHMVALRCF